MTAFLADASPDKRSKLVDELLASPDYAEHWADYWEDELMGQARQGDIDRLALRLWLRDQFAKNVAWDKIVYALVTATGQNSVGGERAKSTSEAERAIKKSDTPINGAVNYVLKFRDTPQDWAGSATQDVPRRADPMRAVPRPQDREVEERGLPEASRRASCARRRSRSTGR